MLVMGPSQKFLTWVRLGQFFVAWVGSGHPSMVWVWKISPKNIKFFNVNQFGSQKIFSGWVKGNLDQRQVDLLFTAGQK